MTTKTGHLFAGAGGGLYADLILGHEPVFAVEWDDYAAKCLRERTAGGWFPGLQLYHGDVRLFDSSAWKGKVDSIHAGFPCQDISVAGNGAGIEGERSGLWSEVIRIAGEIQPRELFLENSPAITSRGLGRVLGDLADLGFDAEWCVLPASAVGAPHIRARWWCLARRPNADSLRELQPQGSKQNQRGRHRDMGQKMADANGLRWNWRTWREKTGGNELAHRNTEMAHTHTERLQKREILSRGQGKTRQPHKGKTTQRSGWWSTEPGLDRVVNGLANRGNRIKALGNGQVPLQAAAAYILLNERFST